jgi:hemoglobin
MNLTRHLLITLGALALGLIHVSAQGPAKPGAADVNTVCPISGKPADPKVTTTYEDRTYAFAEEACRTKWVSARESSLYHKLGGWKSIDAAVDLFYVKVLADKRVNHFFEDINMSKQHRKQKEFLSAALGGPLPWTGKDMRKAHAGLELTEEHFNAVAENLIATLKELKVSQELIDQVIAVVATTKDDVLQRPKKDSK